MQDFLTVAATATELAAIALLFTTFAHYAWTRTAPHRNPLLLPFPHPPQLSQLPLSLHCQ